jgi:hypothetical protein
MIQKIKNKKYSLETKLYKLLGYSKKRMSSSPFISGDTFRALTNNIYENKNKNISIKCVKKHPIIFVESSLLIEFFKNIHSKIENKYILISHNGDENIGKEYLKYIDDKLHLWFAQNCTIEHNKIIPIPIGLENYYHYNHGRIENFHKLINTNKRKIEKILYGFSIKTNPKERMKALSILEKSNYTEKITKNYNSYDYLKNMQKYIAIASPAGNGLDCHRTWESLYLGTMPIVNNSAMTRYFKSIGLPLYIIDEYSELSEIDGTEFFKSVKKIQNNKSASIWFDYWKNKIESELKCIR